MSVRHRPRQRGGFTLVIVMMLGAILLVMGTAIFSLSVNNSSTTTGNRARTGAALTAESALAYLRNGMGEKLLGLDDRGGALPDNSGPFGLYRRGGRFYLGYPELSELGTVRGMHGLVTSEVLPDSYDATTLKDRTPDARWWVHQLGAVRWIPLSMAAVAESKGILPVAVRQVEVVGESGAGRAAVAQTLRLAVDLSDQRTSRRPEVALAAVSVARVPPPTGPVFNLKASNDQPSRLRVEGPVLVDAPKLDDTWVRLDGKVKVTLNAPLDPGTGRPYGEATGNGQERPLNPKLFALAGEKEKAFLMEGGERRLAKPGQIELDGRVEGLLAEDAPGTLQLTRQLADFVGRAGTVVRKQFNIQHNLLNPAGEKIYDAKLSRFDLTKARRNILYIEGRTLKLLGTPYRVFTYRGQGTLVITADQTCLDLENSSLVPVAAGDSLTILCAIKPEKKAATASQTNQTVSTPTDGSRVDATPLPGSTGVNTTVKTTVNGTANPDNPNDPNGATLPIPPGIRFAFSATVPATILADERGVPFTVRKRDIEFDAGAPQNLPNTLMRLISGVNFGDSSLPSGARVVTLDRRNYVLGRLSRQDGAEAIISLGVNSDRQRSTIQYESVNRATVVPLLRLQARIYSNGSFMSEGTVRLVGSLIAPAITIGQPRYAPNTQNLFYGDSTLGLTFLFDAIYRRLPEGPADWLMTFRPTQRLPGQTNPPVSVARIDTLLWQSIDFDQWRETAPQPEANPVPPEGEPLAPFETGAPSSTVSLQPGR